MKKIKTSLVACFGILAFVGLVTFLIPSPTQGQGGPPSQLPPPLNVKVVNTEAEPVPVTGTINVGNLGDSPLNVRDVNGPNAGNIVTLKNGSGFTRGNFFRVSASGVIETTEFRVPAGKVLIVTNVNWQLFSLTHAGETTGFHIIVGGSGLTAGSVVYFGNTVMGSNGRGGKNDTLATGFAVAENTNFEAFRGESPEGGEVTVVVYGYLVDAPQ